MIGTIEMMTFLKIGCLGMLALVALVVVLALAFGPKNAESLPAGEPFDLRVTSTIVKAVDGKFRYFFDIRNHDNRPFAGEVKITLLNREPGVENGDDTFSTAGNAIQPGVGRAVYIEAFTGPASVHGESCVARFTWLAVVAGKIVAKGVGRIAEKYEDLER